jgi:FkbM family methyltransferase
MLRLLEVLKEVKSNIGLIDLFLLPFTTCKQVLDEKLHEFLLIKKAVKNWRELILFRFGLKKKVIIKLKSGRKIRLKYSDTYFKFWESKYPLFFYPNIKINERKKEVYFRYKNKIVKFHFSIIAGEFEETFIKEVYKWLNFKGKEVVDVGAYVGDSAIYFALNGAKHVYAFEPYPFSWRIASRNISLNNLEKKITLLNEAVGGESKVIYVDEKYPASADEELKEFEKGKKIRVTTLEEIVKRFRLKNAVLKMDCEGCEYNSIINTTNEILRRFNQIIVEYYYGYLNLKRKLEDAGFKVRVSLPKYFFNDNSKNPYRVEGYLFAKLKKV